MTIDRQYVEDTIKNLRSQADQVNGALLLCAEFLKRLDAAEEPAMTIDQLQEAITRGAADGGN